MVEIQILAPINLDFGKLRLWDALLPSFSFSRFFLNDEKGQGIRSLISILLGMKVVAGQ